MKKNFMFLFLFVFSLGAFAQVPATELYNHYTGIREALKQGAVEELTTQTEALIAAHPEAADLLGGPSIAEDITAQELSAYITGSHNPEETAENLAYNLGLVGLAGAQSSYFFQEMGIEDRRVKNFINLLGHAVKQGILSQNQVPEAQRAEFYPIVLSQVVAAEEDAEWLGNHTDSYDFDEAQNLLGVYALLTDEFGRNYNNSYLTQEQSERFVLRRLGPDEFWTEPLDIIAEVVRRSTRAQNSLYKEIDPRDYFFFIQDHFARIFGAEDVQDAIEFSVGNQGDQRSVILLCNADTASLSSGASVQRGPALGMKPLITSWDSFSNERSFTCGAKTYALNVEDVNFTAHAPAPTIVGINETNDDSFNVVLSYIYFGTMDEDTVNNLTGAMTDPEEEGGAGYTLIDDIPIEDSKESLIDALNEADMFFRIGHVQGNNLNISYTRGRELVFRKMQGDTPIIFRVQIPLTESTGSDHLSREELSETLWYRKNVNGRTQSLFAMGIACRSASYIGTWMDAYFEAVINHSDEITIDETGLIHDFDPPYVVGASNTFNSSTHRESREGLESYLQIILTSVAYVTSPNPAFEDREVLRVALFEALAEGDTPYIAESNHEHPHTREMSRRMRVRFVHGDEEIDRVFN